MQMHVEEYDTLLRRSADAACFMVSWPKHILLCLFAFISFLEAAELSVCHAAYVTLKFVSDLSRRAPGTRLLR